MMSVQKMDKKLHAPCPFFSFFLYNEHEIDIIVTIILNIYLYITHSTAVSTLSEDVIPKYVVTVLYAYNTTIF